MSEPLALALLIFVGYTYAGYPLLIALLARLSPRERVRGEAWQPTISVLCSVFNGAELAQAKLETLLALDYPAEKIEILFYDDGSTDETLTAFERLCQPLARASVIAGGDRAGKPTALNALAAKATGEVLLLTDVRQRISPNAAASLVAALGSDGVGCAGGTLVLEGKSGAGAYWTYERFIRTRESRFRSVVGVSGSLYAIRRRDFPALPADTILDDLFVPMVVRLARQDVVLVEEAHAYDIAAEDSREFSRKARTLAGNYQLFARTPALLSPLHNPSWLETTSHKLFRLLCPWALLALLAISAIEAPTKNAFGVLLALQIGALAAAALGSVVGPLGKLARTFVVMNAAAVVGLWRFLRGSQQTTW